MVSGHRASRANRPGRESRSSCPAPPPAAGSSRGEPIAMAFTFSRRRDVVHVLACAREVMFSRCFACRPDRCSDLHGCSRADLGQPRDTDRRLLRNSGCAAASSRSRRSRKPRLRARADGVAAARTAPVEPEHGTGDMRDGCSRASGAAETRRAVIEERKPGTSHSHRPRRRSPGDRLAPRISPETHPAGSCPRAVVLVPDPSLDPAQF